MPKLLKVSSVKRGDVLLVYRLIHYFGGPTTVEEILKKKLPKEKISRQLLNNWMMRGRIPLKRAVRVAKALDVSPYILNYADLSEISSKSPKWDEVVRKSKFLSRDDKKRILELKSPV